MSEIDHGGLRLYGIKHFKCNRVTTLGFKWLKRTTLKFGGTLACLDACFTL